MHSGEYLRTLQPLSNAHRPVGDAPFARSSMICGRNSDRERARGRGPGGGRGGGGYSYLLYSPSLLMILQVAEASMRVGIRGRAWHYGKASRSGLCSPGTCSAWREK